MSKMIFISLPVTDLDASLAFYKALGFVNDPHFTDDTAACMVVDENVFVMHLTEEKFAQFVTGKVGDPEQQTQVLTCFSAASRQEVDDFKAKALAAGGREWKPNIEFGPMYGCSFQDINGNVWEFMHMDQSGG